MIKIAFWGSDNNSQIVLKALKIDPGFKIVTNPTQADVGVLASYGRILTKDELAAPKYGILNIHPSLLPKYRGPTPIPTAILNGEKKTGVSIIKMDEEIDHGQLVAQFELEIFPQDTSESLLKRALTDGARVLKTILFDYVLGKIKLQPQKHGLATYTKKFTREDGQIDWSKPPEYLERMVRAFSLWPGTYTIINKKRLKILKSHLVKDKLVLDTVQLEGKKPVSYKQFLEGYPEAKII